jgi:ABC-type branched-subunit amino acid transport system substrate-binding protein
MRIRQIFFLFIYFLFFVIHSFAQDVKHTIAVFTPLYLDSVFDDTDGYRYGMQFPKFINPGLEFYEGAQMALDSIAKEGDSLQVFVYDTHSKEKSLTQQLEDAASNGVELILGYTTPDESWNISNAARSNKIPYVNVNLPNDAGIRNNPYFVMLNCTLQTHINGIYKYIQKNYSLNSIVAFRKKGRVENVLKSYFDDAAKNAGSVPLKIKWVDLPDSFTVKQLTAVLDSNEHTVCIAGSLNESFGGRLCRQLASVSNSYPLTLIGMPTFDNLTKDFSYPEYKGLEIIYSTPFYNPRTDKVSQEIIDYFNTTMYARPSDMVIRGYEATWRFSKLLMEYGDQFPANINHNAFNVFRVLDIQPVINKQTNTLDYFENKKLFFVKWLDGIIKGVTSL